MSYYAILKSLKFFNSNLIGITLHIKKTKVTTFRVAIKYVSYSGPLFY